MALPELFLQELKMRCNMSDVASEYVSLKRRGRNLVGLCPFHSEKTPSFNVYTESNSYYCFGCGAGGDVINFIMRIENLDYMEAVRLLAQRAGIEVPETGQRQSDFSQKLRIFEANREAARFFHSQLHTEQGKAAHEYLLGRGLTERTIRRFGLGYSPSGGFALCNHLQGLGFQKSELAAANLANYSRNGNRIYDRFTDRVMFPIIDLRGNVIAFGGRIMSDKKPKYLNTSDTEVFKKSSNLFSLNNAKNCGERRLILCEGYMDVIALNQAGFANAVATLGTALTPEQANLMKKYADEVVICYDSDDAGQKATARAIGILRGAGIDIRVVSVPSGKDPDEFIRINGENGYAAFKNILDNSGNDVEYRLSKLRKSVDINQPDGKVAYLNEAVKVLASLENSIERDVYAGKLSEETGVGKQAVIQRADMYSRRRQKETQKQEMRKIQQELSGFGDRLNPQRAGNLRAASAEEGVIDYILSHPDKAESVLKRLPAEKMLTDFNRRLYAYFTDRICSGLSPLTNVAADFTAEENSRIAKILSTERYAASTDAAVEEYIEVLLEQGEKLSREQIENASDSDILEYIEKQRKKRQ